MLVTGATSALGAHVCLQLLKQNCFVIAVDGAASVVQPAPLRRYDESRPPADMPQLVTQVGISLGYPGVLIFELCDVSSRSEVRKLFKKHAPVDVVVHVAEPRVYNQRPESDSIMLGYRATVGRVTTLLKGMESVNCFALVNVSSMAIYGDTGGDSNAQEESVLRPNREDLAHMKRCTDHASAGAFDDIDCTDWTICAGPGGCAYARTKALEEQICLDVARANSRWRMAMARLGVAAGAHPSGGLPLGSFEALAAGPACSQGMANRIVHMAYAAVLDGGRGADRRAPPAILIPRGFATADGTPVRDYVHIVDAAEGITLMVRSLQAANAPRWDAYNLCTGEGLSVLQIAAVVAKVSRKELASHFVWQDANGRFSAASTVGLNTKARGRLRWSPRFTIQDIVAHVLQQALGMGSEQLRLRSLGGLQNGASKGLTAGQRCESLADSLARMMDTWEITRDQLEGAAGVGGQVADDDHVDDREEAEDAVSRGLQCVIGAKQSHGLACMSGRASPPEKPRRPGKMGIAGEARIVTSSVPLSLSEEVPEDADDRHSLTPCDGGEACEAEDGASAEEDEGDEV